MNADIKNNNENIMRILTEMEVVYSATRDSKFEWYSNGCHNIVIPLFQFPASSVIKPSNNKVL